jgi:hypothetical protein
MYLLPRKGGRRLSLAIHPAGIKPVVAKIAPVASGNIVVARGPVLLAGSFPPRPALQARPQIIGNSVSDYSHDVGRSHFVLAPGLTISMQCNLVVAARSFGGASGPGKSNAGITRLTITPLGSLPVSGRYVPANHDVRSRRRRSGARVALEITARQGDNGTMPGFHPGLSVHPLADSAAAQAKRA